VVASAFAKSTAPEVSFTSPCECQGFHGKNGWIVFPSSYCLMPKTMSVVFAVALALLFCFLLSSCDQISNNDAALKHRLDDTESKLAVLQSTVADLKGSKEWDDLVKGWDKIAYLTPGAEGYSTVGFDLG